MEERKYYPLQSIKELRELTEIDNVNNHLKQNWLLLQVTTNGIGFNFLVGRID